MGDFKKIRNKFQRIVAQGYDRITRNYRRLVESMDPAVREKYLSVLTDRLPIGAQILELGCGSGVPMTRFLAGRFKVTGVDISMKQLALARQNVPDASFVQADMAQVGFAGGAFDAVAAFYSIIHVPRHEHLRLLTNVHRMLRPEGLLVITMGAADSPDTVEQDWLGAPMFFSHFDSPTNVALVQQAGFVIIQAEDETEWEYGEPVCFHWIVARKPGDCGDIRRMVEV